MFLLLLGWILAVFAFLENCPVWVRSSHACCAAAHGVPSAPRAAARWLGTFCPDPLAPGARHLSGEAASWPQAAAGEPGLSGPSWLRSGAWFRGREEELRRTPRCPICAKRPCIFSGENGSQGWLGDDTMTAWRGGRQLRGHTGLPPRAGGPQATAQPLQAPASSSPRRGEHHPLPGGCGGRKGRRGTIRAQPSVYLTRMDFTACSYTSVNLTFKHFKGTYT